MAPTDGSNATTRRDAPDGDEPALWLVVVGDGILATHQLHDGQEVTIGRASGNTVRVDHPSVSRHHAVLHTGPTLAIEDLGSANGTRVRGADLRPGERAPIAPGEVVDLGTVMCLVQRRAQPVRLRQLWTAEILAARVDDEIARARRDGGRLALLHLRAGEAAGSALESALAELLRPIDVIGRAGAGEYQVLVPGASDEEIGALAARLRERLGGWNLELRTGRAIFPGDGADAATLARAAAAGCDPVRGGDGPAAPRRGRMDMSDLRRMVARVATSPISVLLLGETGVGKEVLAETIHGMSPRAERPFLRLNCAALSEHLIESELFGHEKGAFTGAQARKPGLLETAEGGTVFLDEVGDLPAATQVKLLRVLEERAILRVGGLKPVPIDVRFVAATNRDLEAEVARGTFRKDLFYRLNGVTIVVPPLRERVPEIADLARAFLEKASAALGRTPPALASEALAALRRHDWPGNIRELRNVMERAVALCEGETILADHLPLEKMRAPSPSAGEPVAGVRDELASLERRRIVEALEQCAGNQSRAAKLLGISRSALLHRLDALGLPRPKKGR